MAGEYTVPKSNKRGKGVTIRPIGVWVLGETVFPTSSQDPRWQGYVQRDHSQVTTSYGAADQANSSTYAEQSSRIQD